MGSVDVRPGSGRSINERDLFWNARLQGVLHDLRTPLTVVMGYAELLLSGNPRDDQLHGLETILKAGRDLSERIDDLLADSGMDEVRNEFFGLSAVDKTSPTTTTSESDLLGTQAANFVNERIGVSLRRKVKLPSTTSRNAGLRV